MSNAYEDNPSVVPGFHHLLKKYCVHNLAVDYQLERAELSGLL